MAAGRKQVGSSQLLTALQDALQNKPEQVPGNWKTTEQLAEEWQFSQSHANRLIAAGLKKGLIEARRFRIINGSRGVFPITHYRLKP